MDGKAFGIEVVDIVKDYLGRNLSPVIARLDAIDKRFGELPVPTNGKDADAEAISNVVMLRLKPEVEGLAKIITQEIPTEVARAVEKLPAPKDGTSVSVDDVAPIIIAEVAKRFDAMPVPKDGLTPTAEDIEPIVARAIAAIPKAKDGVGVAGALIDRDGNLILTTTDGAQKELGKVVGKDGESSEAQVIETAPDDVAAMVSKAIRLMAETPEIVARETEGSNGGGVNIHLPNVIVPDVVIPEIKLPEIRMAPVHVTVEQPKKRRLRTIVQEHDSRGRVKKFEQEEID